MSHSLDFRPPAACVQGGYVHFLGKSTHPPTGCSSWGPRPWLWARRAAGPGSRSNEPRQQGVGLQSPVGPRKCPWTRDFFANLFPPFPFLFNPPQKFR